MKKLLFFSLFLFLCNFLRAQKNDQYTHETNTPPQVIYFQVGGPAPIFSINYDRRIKSITNGFGFTVGIGYYGFSRAHVFSIPASLNYLFGNRTNFIEVAAGATFISQPGSTFLNQVTTAESGFIFHANGGYRYQPEKNFFFRVGVSPLFAGGGYITSFYLGLGRDF